MEGSAASRIIEYKFGWLGGMVGWGGMLVQPRAGLWCRRRG